MVFLDEGIGEIASYFIFYSSFFVSFFFEEILIRGKSFVVFSFGVFGKRWEARVIVLRR